MNKAASQKDPNVTKAPSKGATRILEQVGMDRLNKASESSYREFVESINRAKEAEMERAMTFR